MMIHVTEEPEGIVFHVLISLIFSVYIQQYSIAEAYAGPNDSDS